nr:undecaprenyl-phosphate glucose phosphotransferase [Burkholderia sp. BCC1972]
MRSFNPIRNAPVVQGKSSWLRLADIVLLAATAWMAKRWFDGSQQSVSDAVVIALSISCALVLFPSVGTYDGAEQRTSWRRIWWMPGSVAVALCVGAVTAVAFNPAYARSLEWVIGWFALATVMLSASRAVCWWLGIGTTRRAARYRPVALVGHRARCLALAGRDRDVHVADLPLQVAAILDMSEPPAANVDDARVFLDLDTFVECVRRVDVGEIRIVLPLSEADRVGAIVRAFDKDLVDIRFMPDLTEVTPLRPCAARSGYSLDLVASPLSARARVGKAIFDRMFAGLALIAIAPLLAAIAIAVKLSSPGPVLFRQRRKGAYGCVFTIYKFRTMREHDAAASGEVRQATRGDPRITRVGALLRRTSLDELPQFFNVLMGDMSVVGPRPHAVEHDLVYQELVDGYIQRYRVKPGITGWAQVNGLRGETDRIEKMQRRIEHDLYYLRNWSLAFDVRIVLATLFHGKAHSNAY